MNNEETVVMKPRNGKKVATVATAAVVGGAVGGGATYAATEMLHAKEAGEQKQEDEAQTTERPVVTAAEEPQKEQHGDAPKEEVAVKVDENANEEPDYTGHNGADPVTPNPEPHDSMDETNDANSNEVQVLGVYEAQGDQGQTMQAAVLTNGEEVAAVIDVNGDGVADVLAVDENHNQQIDEGEVYDLSSEHVQMAGFQQTYEQQEQMQQEQIEQEHDTFAYNASDDLQDYNNDADSQYI